MELISNDARGHDRFQVLELDVWRSLYFGVQIQAIEFIHAGGSAAHCSWKIGAIGAGKPVRLGGQPHRLEQA